MPSQVLNFLWLGLDLPAPPDPEDGSICVPMPQNYIESVQRAAARHPDVDVILWVDSARLTEQQTAYMHCMIEAGTAKAQLKDLRSIPEYDHEEIYNKSAAVGYWRDDALYDETSMATIKEGQESLIWRQVDAAKALISLQGSYDQTFFADLDHADLDLNSAQVQDILTKHGFFIGSGGDKFYWVENQVWGFTREREDFFKLYYDAGLEQAYRGHNGWPILKVLLNNLLEEEGLKLEDVCLLLKEDGSKAVHPGHKWKTGKGDGAKIQTISKGDLEKVFSRKSVRADPAEEGRKPGVLTKIKDRLLRATSYFKQG